MPYINTNNDISCIRSLMTFRPDSGRVLNQLAQVLLSDDASISKNERELIAAFVSSGNECRFCMTTHAPIAAHHLDEGDELSTPVCNDFEPAPISDKLKALLRIADKVRIRVREVNEHDVEAARKQGTSDLDIHDMVIAAVF